MSYKLLSSSAIALFALTGCYAYAGPPRHARHRHERVVVVERRRPVVVERVVVHDGHRHHDDRY
ncbi:MAG TPA: hypothetical protein VEQ59_14245 [Polyangiaceae bacterium]|nr:hypothetical protein [Polyangiaceae bacterium]